MNKTFLDGKTLPEKMLELEKLVQDFLAGTDPAVITAIQKSITEINSHLSGFASDAEFQLTKKDITTLTANLDALLKTVTGLSGDKNRGHFATEAELNALADPKVDEFAWVGSAGHWEQYVYEASGWTKTGGTSTHTTGYDPAEIVAIKTAATTLQATVTALTATVTANTQAAAAAKAAADAAAAAAAKNTAAIAGLGGGGTPGLIELSADDTPETLVAQLKAHGTAIPVTIASEYSDLPQQLLKPHAGDKLTGDQVMRVAKVHITGLIKKDDSDTYLINAYVDATIMLAILENEDTSAGVLLESQTSGETAFIGDGTDANYNSYGGFKLLNHNVQSSGGGYGGYVTGGTKVTKLYYYFKTFDRNDAALKTLGACLAHAEIEYSNQ